MNQCSICGAPTVIVKGIIQCSKDPQHDATSTATQGYSQGYSGYNAYNSPPSPSAVQPYGPSVIPGGIQPSSPSPSGGGAQSYNTPPIAGGMQAYNVPPQAGYGGAPLGQMPYPSPRIQQQRGKSHRRYPGATTPASFQPFMKLRCPFCGIRFHPSDCAIFSRTNNVVMREAPKGLFKYLARLWITPLTGEIYTPERACRLCPRCEKQLPFSFEFSNNLNIAVVGDSFSGKSHYIAAFLDQIARGGLTQNGSSYVYFRPQTRETEALFDQYLLSLHDQTIFPPTQRSVEPPPGEPMVWSPLIYQLVIRNTVEAQYANVVNLIIYDISGEDFADAEKLARVGWPVLQANALIYLADPLSIKSVRDTLPAHLRLSKQAQAIQQERAPHEILDHVIEVLQQYRGLVPGERVDIPVAIMLPKSDLLEEIIPKKDQGNFRFLKEVQYNGKVDGRDVDAVNREVQAVLGRLGEGGLLRQRQLFSTLSYFATSATGCSPDATGKFAKIQPRRCLDPLLWVLLKLEAGVLPNE